MHRISTLLYAASRGASLSHTNVATAAAAAAAMVLTPRCSRMSSNGGNAKHPSLSSTAATPSPSSSSSSASASSSSFHDKTAPLRADIRLLGKALGETIRARAGQEALDKVEELRFLSKQWRQEHFNSVQLRPPVSLGASTAPSAANSNAPADASGGQAGQGTPHDAEKESFDKLVQAIAALSPKDMYNVARAFGHFLSLANNAEQHHRERRRRIVRLAFQRSAQESKSELETSATNTMALTTGSIIRNLIHAEGKSKEEVYKAILNSRIELVLTAHPTQVHRRTIQKKFVAIVEALQAHDRAQLLEEKQAAVEQLRREVASLWSSDEIRRLKPTPVDEAIAGLHVAEQVLWDAVPAYLRHLSLRMEQALDRSLPPSAPLFKFGSWLGGDRDGNSFVTPDVTRDVILRGRWMAAELYHREIDALYYELSMTPCNEELRAQVGPSIREPYREILRHLRDRLQATKEFAKSELARLELRKKSSLNKYEKQSLHSQYSQYSSATSNQSEFTTNTVTSNDSSGPDAGSSGASSHSKPSLSPQAAASVQPISKINEILQPLELCYRSLQQSGLGIIAEGKLLDVLRRVHVFGLAMFQLDIRQESTQHTRALDAVTKYLGFPVSYARMTEDERMAFLLSELASKRPLIPVNFTTDRNVKNALQEHFSFSELSMVRDVIDTFQMLQEQIPETLNAYVISMTKAPSDILAVYLLQKEARINPLRRVVPLFETLDDLSNSVKTMQTLFQCPEYLRRIGGFQEIMIGYSDSTKDAGRLAAAWALYQAQEQLVDLCKQHNVRLRLFHGRGGSVSRGSGPEGKGAYHAILSQPVGSVNQYLRVTEQGEVIHKKFAYPAVASTSLDIYAAGVLSSEYHTAKPPSEKWRAMMNKLSDWSCSAYRDIVRNDPRFVAYFRSATPEPELGTLNIGSRPSRRKTAATQAPGDISSLRAIPWNFAWTQTRLHLATWLGVGDAISKAVADGHLETLRDMYASWPFFQTTIDLISMVLVKSEPRIAAYYDEMLVEDPSLRKLGEELRYKLEQTIQAVGQITGEDILQASNIVLQHALLVRNPYVDPLNLLQARLLKAVREREASSSASELPSGPSALGEPSEDELLRDALVITINGIAAGMQNTG